MNTIKILWVDDKFMDSNNSFTKRVNEDIDECQDPSNTIIVDKVSNRDDFLNRLSSKTKYAAIILDAQTADKINDSPDIKTFDLHLRPIDKLNYNVLKYVYSSYPDQIAKMAHEYGFDIRDKSEIEPYDLITEIKDRLSFEFPIVPEIMMSIRENFISESNEKYLRNIINGYYDAESVPLEDMRYILEDIFVHLTKTRLINFNALPKNAGLSDKIKFLLEGGELNGTRIHIPYWVCPIEIRYAMQCLEPCSQLYHHDSSTVWSRMENMVFKNSYEQFFKEMAYNAFFLTMRWYYHFMLNEKNSPSNGNYSNKHKQYYY